MCDAGIHGVMGGGKRLAQYLSAEYLGAADVAAFTAKDIVLDALKTQKPQEVFENGIHLSKRERQTEVSRRPAAYRRRWRFLYR